MIKNENMSIRMIDNSLSVPNTPNTHTSRARESIVPESEKTLEARLRKEIEARGGMALKLGSQNHRGLPDRLILMPGGWALFAEIKTTGKKPTKLQCHCHQQLIQLGFSVGVIDSTRRLNEMLSVIDYGMGKI